MPTLRLQVRPEETITTVCKQAITAANATHWLIEFEYKDALISVESGELTEDVVNRWLRERKRLKKAEKESKKHTHGH